MNDPKRSYEHASTLLSFKELRYAKIDKSTTKTKQ